MIEGKQAGAALYALNAVLFLIREMAYKQASHKDIASALDIAEYLPRLLAESDSKSGAFRDYLVDLSKRFPQFALAVERFDRGAPEQW